MMYSNLFSFRKSIFFIFPLYNTIYMHNQKTSFFSSSSIKREGGSLLLIVLIYRLYFLHVNRRYTHIHCLYCVSFFYIYVLTLLDIENRKSFGTYTIRKVNVVVFDIFFWRFIINLITSFSDHFTSEINSFFIN